MPIRLNIKLSTGQLLCWIATILISAGVVVYLFALGLWSMIRHPIKFLRWIVTS